MGRDFRREGGRIPCRLILIWPAIRTRDIIARCLGLVDKDHLEVVKVRAMDATERLGRRQQEGKTNIFLGS